MQLETKNKEKRQTDIQKGAKEHLGVQRDDEYVGKMCNIIPSEVDNSKSTVNKLLV